VGQQTKTLAHAPALRRDKVGFLESTPWQYNSKTHANRQFIAIKYGAENRGFGKLFIVLFRWFSMYSIYSRGLAIL
jgi:hypothetical protein